MDTVRKLLVLTIILAGFIFGVSFSTLYAQVNIAEGSACTCKLPIPLLIPMFASLGVLIGSIIYYLIFPKPVEKEASENVDDILSLLKPGEKDIVKKIIQAGGEIPQSKLSKEFGKVKVFRILEDLAERGIVEKVEYGRTNKIKITKKFDKIFRKFYK